MSSGYCHRHGAGRPCSCLMGNLYRFTEPVVLYLIRIKGSVHGYELIKLVQEHALTDSVIEPGALYRALRTLESSGYVASVWDVAGNGPARRLYELTPDGERHLEEWMVVLSGLSRSMGQFVAQAKSLVDPTKV